MPTFSLRSAAGVVVLVLGGACTAVRPAPVVDPTPDRPAPPLAPAAAAAAPAVPALPTPAPGLPPFPRVTGALVADMVYPPEGHLLAVRDSTFVFGNVGNGDATLTINGRAVTVHPNGAFMAFLPVPADSAYTLHASLPTGESVVAVRRVKFPVRATAPRAAVVLDTVGYPRLVTLANTNEYATADTDMVTVARPAPGGTYQWFLIPGTVVQATGRLGGSTRIRLDSQIEVWVEESGIASNAAGAASAEHAPAVHRVSAARAASLAGYTDVVLTMDARAPYAVDQSGDRISLTLYHTRANLDILRYDTNDPTVRLVRHEQVASDRVRFDVDLRHAAVGYLVFWRNGALVLRVRHLPAVDPRAPLRGRVIAVDAGHPPGGATGPTRLREPEATLGVAQQLKALLEARGARVLMLRATMDAVALGDRPIEARRQGAEAFVSVHLNAFADGANPFAAPRGSGTFFFQPQSEPLARDVQQGLVRYLGLRDEGINFNNLAVARATWFPSVLCEGAWVVMPQQEAALRTVEFQRAYALGIADGLEAYFRSLAR